MFGEGDWVSVNGELGIFRGSEEDPLDEWGPACVQVPDPENPSKPLEKWDFLYCWEEQIEGAERPDWLPEGIEYEAEDAG